MLHLVLTQSLKKQLETFSRFDTIALYRKRKGTRILTPENKRMSCVID